MSIYFTKILAQLIYPLNLSLLLSIMAGILLLRRWQRLGSLCLFIAVSWLWLCATPVFSDKLRNSLEQIYPAEPIAMLPQADAILVLGGCVEPASPPRQTINLLAGADRVWYAAQLYRAGKAPQIVVSGGQSPWSGMEKSEAEAMAEFLTDLGIPDSAILLEMESLNTYQNALLSKPLLEKNNIQSVLLVTSALHFPRAFAIFKTMGIVAFPAPTDFEITDTPNTLLRWLPDTSALDGSTRAIKEYLGWYVYKMQGWIK
jgi:uncharacterized SAM-binding protein YcdF (DUF218 family)